MPAAPNVGFGYRRRAIFAVGATAALIVLGAVQGTVSLYGRAIDGQDELRSARAAISRTREAAELRSLSPAADLRLLAGASPAEAQAALQTALKDLAKRHDLVIESLQAMPGERLGGVQTSKLRMTASIAESQLGALLAGMIGHSPQLLPEAAEIKPEGQRANEQPGVERRLAIRLDVVGFGRAVQSQREAR